jgi:recombination protein RecT
MNQLSTQTNADGGTIKQLIESSRFKNAVASALPAHLRPDRFVRVALTALTRTPKLAQCDQASFFQSLMTLSQFGLEPDGRNAHLIPFENRKRGVTECQLIIDYKGLVDLAMRSGKIAYIHADKVCVNDRFEYDRGEIKTHLINFKEPRGEAYAYYAICRFKDETEKCEVMTRDEVDKIRGRSRAGQAGPWVTDFDEMAKKTVFRRLSKWLQLSPEYRDALDVDADVLEENRFQAALPAIARPVIGNGSGGRVKCDGNHGEPICDDPECWLRNPETVVKPKGKAKGKLKVVKPEKDESPEPTVNAETVAGPNATEVYKRLAEEGYTVTELLLVAIKNHWVDAPAGYGGLPEELADVPLASVGEEKLGVWLEDWDTVADQIAALRKGDSK